MIPISNTNTPNNRTPDRTPTTTPHTTSRRSFLQSSAILSAGVMLAPGPFFNPKSPIGLQLYTVREAMQSDPKATLAQVAKIGYTTVEGATYTGSELFYGFDVPSFRMLLNDNGLKMPSAHYRLGQDKDHDATVKGTLMHDWDKAVDDAAALGIEYMVCAYLSPTERGNLDQYKRTADELNEAGEKCQKAGLQLCYHNHDFEFILHDGMLPYTLLLNNTDSKLVKMEMDMYWVTKAGQDPLALFTANPHRFPLWHLKDMDRTPEKAFTEVGSGIINFKEIMSHAKLAGLQYFFVEQDHCPGSPMASITKSIRYIKSHLI